MKHHPIHAWPSPAPQAQHSAPQPPPRFVTEEELNRRVAEAAAKPSEFSNFVDLVCLILAVVWVARGCS